MSDYLVSEDFDYAYDAPADAPEPAPLPPVVIAWGNPRNDGSVDGIYDVGTIRFYVVHYPKTWHESESFYVNVYDTSTGADDAGVVKLLSEEKVIRHLTFWRDTLTAMAPPF